MIAALFPIVDPIGGAATFLAMADRLPIELHQLLSKKIAICSFCLLFFSMVFGTKVLSFFGIALYAVQIGGGLAFAISSWRLLERDADRTTPEPVGADYVATHAFYLLVYSPFQRIGDPVDCFFGVALAFAPDRHSAI